MYLPLEKNATTTIMLTTVIAMTTSMTVNIMVRFFTGSCLLGETALIGVTCCGSIGTSGRGMPRRVGGSLTILSNGISSYSGLLRGISAWSVPSPSDDSVVRERGSVKAAGSVSGGRGATGGGVSVVCGDTVGDAAACTSLRRGFTLDGVSDVPVESGGCISVACGFT